MSTKHRDHGTGSMKERQPGVWRLRYYDANGDRCSTTFKGGKKEAQAALADRLKTVRDGDHVAPDRASLGDWIEEWLAARKEHLATRSWERYTEVCRVHILPALGNKPLQRVTGAEIDRFYTSLRGKVSLRTIHFIHTLLKGILAEAARKDRIVSNPAAKATVPPTGKTVAGQALDATQLKTLLAGFADSSLFPIVALAISTGMRRNEILALQWSDINFAARTISVTKSVQETWLDGKARTTKSPKNERGNRVIPIADNNLFELLRRERERHLRIVAGIGDRATADMSLMEARHPLPLGALLFPKPAAATAADLTIWRDSGGVSETFSYHASKLGFPGLRFHDLRHSHATLLLDQGVPLHVAAARLGHSPTVLLKTYAHRNATADKLAADAVAALGLLAPQRG